METGTPQRHGCLTTYLVFMLIVNTLGFLGYLFVGGRLVAQNPSLPAAFPYIMAVGTAINIALVIFLFRWSKMAFYGFCLLAVVVLVINLAVGLNPLSAAAGLLGPVILYGVFQIGGDRKGWNYLK